MDQEINKIIEKLEEKKLKSIEAFDLKNKSEIFKYIILATCTNEKNSRAIILEVEEELINIGYNINKEGEFPGDWVILDLGNILIEIFAEDTRKQYNLEKLWGDSKNRVIEINKKKRRKRKQ